MTRNITEEDYNTIQSWWTDWGWSVIPRESLPNRGTGGLMSVDDEGNPVCALFLYETNSNIAWSEFLISDPHNKNRGAYVKEVIDAVCDLAKKKGFSILFTCSSHKSAVNVYKKAGFNISESNSSELIKIL